MERKITLWGLLGMLCWLLVFVALAACGDTAAELLRPPRADAQEPVAEYECEPGQTLLVGVTPGETVYDFCYVADDGEICQRGIVPWLRGTDTGRIVCGSTTTVVRVY